MYRIGSNALDCTHLVIFQIFLPTHYSTQYDNLGIHNCINTYYITWVGGWPDLAVRLMQFYSVLRKMRNMTVT